MYQFFVAMHVLAAAVWTGGHVAPAAMHINDSTRIASFEQTFSNVALASLAVLTLTGVALAAYWLGRMNRLLDLSHQVSRMVSLKLILLDVTAVLGGRAYHLALPRLTGGRLGSFALYAWAVTGVSSIMLLTGVTIRTGGIVPSDSDGLWITW